jgi:hypothetical protein
MNTTGFVFAAILCAVIMLATVLAASNAGITVLEAPSDVATR